jgi:hypothetical protein
MPSVSLQNDFQPVPGVILIMGKFTPQCHIYASGNCHILAKPIEH